MLKQRFIQFWKNIGFSLSSSRYLARRMVSLIDVDNIHHVVELGSWLWPVTRVLVERFSTDVRIDLFEINPEAVEVLTKEYWHMKNIHIHAVSAVEVANLFPHGSVDAVISTLPLGSISPEWVEHVLQATQKVLKKWWQFVQYQYWMVNRRNVKKYFRIKKTHFEPRNIGAAFIYHAIKL